MNMNHIPKYHELNGLLVHLRTPCHGDYLQFKSILNDKETMAALLPYFKVETWTDEMVKVRYESFEKQQQDGRCLNYAVVDPTTEIIVGSCGFKKIDLINKRAEFGIILHKNAWGKGISNECFTLCLEYAFSDLTLQTVYFTTDDHNVRMKGFFKKISLPQKGVIEKNCAYFELSKNEWPLIRAKLTCAD